MTEENLNQQKKLIEILKNEILDLDIKGCGAEITEVRIATLAARLVEQGVIVEEIIPQF